jgi:hypothetical protein
VRQSNPRLKEAFGIKRVNSVHSVETETDPLAAGLPMTSSPFSSSMPSRSSRAPSQANASAPVAAGTASSGNPSGNLCRQCGGSGMLRLGDQRYRTCLDCLGQGQIPSDPGTQGLFFRAISVSASVSR